MSSPYAHTPERQWPDITRQLLDDFPLSSDFIVRLVQDSWEEIYTSTFGRAGLQIGRDIFLPAQATGVILERLFAHNLAQADSRFRGGTEKHEKDIICLDNPRYSFEIKTSSSTTGLYGNRSTGHRSDTRTKHRTGYYLVINYKLPKENDLTRHIYNIRFGWIDDEDWVGQAQPTGQQASIGVRLARLKLLTLYSSGGVK